GTAGLARATEEVGHLGAVPGRSLFGSGLLFHGLHDVHVLVPDTGIGRAGHEAVVAQARTTRIAPTADGGRLRPGPSGGAGDRPARRPPAGRAGTAPRRLAQPG